jgi:predicted ester cyclase
MTAFPDLRVEVSSYTVDDLRMVQEWISTGTHQGELMGLPPTGRWTENYGALVTICDDNGRVIEGSVYWNPLAMFRQLGLEPPLVAASV